MHASEISHSHATFRSKPRFLVFHHLSHCWNGWISIAQSGSLTSMKGLWRVGVNYSALLLRLLQYEQWADGYVLWATRQTIKWMILVSFNSFTHRLSVCLFQYMKCWNCIVFVITFYVYCSWGSQMKPSWLTSGDCNDVNCIMFIA